MVSAPIRNVPIRIQTSGIVTVVTTRLTSTLSRFEQEEQHGEDNQHHQRHDPGDPPEIPGARRRAVDVVLPLGLRAGLLSGSLSWRPWP